jgi:transcriptional pleiotropic regulator of transition state genes
VVLPIELRRIFGIAEDDGLEIYTENDQIILRKHKPVCVFCGNVDKMTSFKGKNICEDCFMAMSKKID